MLAFHFRRIAVFGAHHWHITEVSDVLGITNICADSAQFGKNVLLRNILFLRITSAGLPTTVCCPL